MDTITILHDLWRRRVLVVGVCLLALFAGGAVMYSISFPPQSRAYEVGVATTRILVDTPSSQVVEVAPRGSALLALQANLLASLMVDGVIKAGIAHRAGLRPSQITGVTDAATAPSSSGPAPVSAPPGPRAFVLTTHVLTDSSGNQVPIIELDTQAPNRAAAGGLAAAAIAGLGDYLASKAALQRIPEANRLQVTSLGAPEATTAARGPSPLMAVGASIFVLALGCASILAVPGVGRRWRAAATFEQLGDDRPLLWDGGQPPDEPFFAEVPEPPAPVPPDAVPAVAMSNNRLANNGAISPRLRVMGGRLVELYRLRAGAAAGNRISNGTVRADQDGSGPEAGRGRPGRVPWGTSSSGEASVVNGTAGRRVTGESAGTEAR